MNDETIVIRWLVTSDAWMLSKPSAVYPTQPNDTQITQWGLKNDEWKDGLNVNINKSTSQTAFIGV